MAHSISPITGKLEQHGEDCLQQKSHYKWSIERFSTLNFQSMICYYSPTFQFEKEGINWNVVLQLREPAEQSGYFSFSVFIRDESLNAIMKQNEISLRSSFSLRNTNSEIVSDLSLSQLMNGGMKNFGKYIHKGYLLSKLINDTLVICMDVTHSINFYYNWKSGIQYHKEFGPTQKMAEDFKSLWMHKENTDFVIAVGEQDIPVHSIILCARSKVFAAMLRHDTLEKNIRRVEVTDFQKNTMNAFLEFLYSGSIHSYPIDADLALELLRASDKYEVSDLKSYCSKYLMFSLNNENACDILVSADIYNAEILRNHAASYICKNFPKEDFEAKRSLFLARPELLFDIVKRFGEQKEAEKVKSDGQGSSGNKRPRNQ